jgi:hypothetical protein
LKHLVRGSGLCKPFSEISSRGPEKLSVDLILIIGRFQKDSKDSLRMISVTSKTVGRNL